ncbi:3-oxoacyl-[acyl-carrier-protein] synthase III C-terminal domain-containing protein [Streptomyces shenzhenensis]|uniref:3-oxoacyl-[acyl-carrier-protein] synthase III C-terminal domain-containing protein n=1 Tax=Streptomyces shenzhenensis TaxID=943815 RepID=UPI003D9199CE
MARALIAAGSAQRVLVIGAETISRYLDPQDPSTSALFADGAGAAVVRAGVRGAERGEIGTVMLGSDGSLADLIHAPGGGSRHPVPGGPGSGLERYITMSGLPVFNNVVKRMAGASCQAVAAAGWELADVDRFVIHQANTHILTALGELLDIPFERMATNIQHVGNQRSGRSCPTFPDGVCAGRTPRTACPVTWGMMTPGRSGKKRRRGVPQRMRVRRSVVTAVACALLAGASMSCTGGSAPAEGPGTDLLDGRDWAHFAGAKPTPSGVRITRLDRRITRQDGSGGQPNPPVNLRGPHLVFRGDIRIEARLRHTDGTDAYLHLYGETPVVYDEWRRERRGVRIGVAGGRLRFDRWDGDSDRPALTRTFGKGFGDEVRLAVEVRGTGWCWRPTATSWGPFRGGTSSVMAASGSARTRGVAGRAGRSADSARCHWAGDGCPSGTPPG